MDIKSDIFNLNSVRDYEKHLFSFPPQEQSKRLKIFINKACIIRHLLPSTNNENRLLQELSRLMEKPIPEMTMKETKKLLAEDRSERMFRNSQIIFRRPHQRYWQNFILDKGRNFR